MHLSTQFLVGICAAVYRACGVLLRAKKVGHQRHCLDF
jgi:hypothetical protein